MPTSFLQIHARDTTSSVAQLSIRARSAAYFGRVHRQESIMNWAVLTYGKALRHLNEVLQDYEKAVLYLYCLVQSHFRATK
jgi:hypothetical protein